MKIDLKKPTTNPLLYIQKYNKVVKFGIPRTTSARVDENGDQGLTNADILAIMEAGSIRMNIPPRKLLEPVIVKHQKQIHSYFKKIFDCLIQHRDNEADAIMEQLAFRMETWTKAYFREDNGWAPNSPITISGGWMINKVTGKPVYIKGKGSDTPLIDTGELRKSIRGLVVNR